MKVYSYVVARDFGFAPNPFFGVCSLATCKPVIRRTANVGDWIVGTGSASRGRQGRLVFAMQVSRTMTFTEYWNDADYEIKRPNLRGSQKLAFGDNIYHKFGQRFIQADSHHSYADGSPNPHNIRNDTQTDRLLLADKFVYWGGDGPAIPKRFRKAPNICAVRGHKCQFPDAFAAAFVGWIEAENVWGCPGRPLDWDRT